MRLAWAPLCKLRLAEAQVPRPHHFEPWFLRRGTQAGAASDISMVPVGVLRGCKCCPRHLGQFGMQKGQQASGLLNKVCPSNPGPASKCCLLDGPVTIFWV